MRSAFEGSHFVDISSRLLSDDLQLYIVESVQARIHSDIESQRIPTQDPSLEGEIVQTLKNKACDM